MPLRYAGCLLIAALWTLVAPAFAQDDRLEVGVRAILLASQGEPSNDMPGGGFAVRWHWKDAWRIGAGVERFSFDYERPHRALGISQDPALKVIDGSNRATRVSGWIERRYERDGAWVWFWTAGLGYASVSADDVSGPTGSGGSFDIVTNASDELQVLSSIGLKRPMGARWMLEGALHLEQHFSNYELQDRVSGATGKIGPHTPVGLSFGFSYVW
jgi:hypothetical protein